MRASAEWYTHTPPTVIQCDELSSVLTTDNKLQNTHHPNSGVRRSTLGTMIAFLSAGSGIPDVQTSIPLSSLGALGAVKSPPVPHVACEGQRITDILNHILLHGWVCV